MKRRSAHAIEKSTRGKKAEVRKWMLWYSGQETMTHALRTQQYILHDWLRVDNRTMVRQLQTIEELMYEIIVEEENG
jgi:hypothetical protein